MFWHRKSSTLTLENLDARLRLVEVILATPLPANWRRDPPRAPATVEGSLASLARAAGFDMPPEKMGGG
jgi:hypothetical protein